MAGYLGEALGGIRGFGRGFGGIVVGHSAAKGYEARIGRQWGVGVSRYILKDGMRESWVSFDISCLGWLPHVLAGSANPQFSRKEIESTLSGLNLIYK